MDEFSFNVNLAPKKGWIKKGVKLYIEGKNKSINYTLLGAITENCILGFKIMKGGSKSKIFFTFLFELYEFCLKNYSNLIS